LTETREEENAIHLEFLPQKADIKKGASHDEVVKALEKLGVKIIPKAPPKEKKEKEVPKETTKKKILKLPAKKKTAAKKKEAKVKKE